MAFDFEIIRPLNYIAHSPPGSISPLLEGLTAFTRATYGCSNALYTYPKTWETELLYIKITITHDVLLIQSIRIPTSFRAPGAWAKCGSPNTHVAQTQPIGRGLVTSSAHD